MWRAPKALNPSAEAPKYQEKLVPLRQFVDPRDNYRSHVFELLARSLRTWSLLTDLRGALIKTHFWPVKWERAVLTVASDWQTHRPEGQMSSWFPSTTPAPLGLAKSLLSLIDNAAESSPASPQRLATPNNLNRCTALAENTCCSATINTPRVWMAYACLFAWGA